MPFITRKAFCGVIAVATTATELAGGFMRTSSSGRKHP